MKKLISIMAACLLVFGFAGMASADYCAQCETDPGNIDRGCEGVQDWCRPFDYENWNDYCATGKEDFNRAIFELCDCYPDLEIGDTIYVSMEILVDKGAGPVAGDNGVFWAEDVGTMGPLVQAFRNQSDVCAVTRGATPNDSFKGIYNYLKANGQTGTPTDGRECAVADDNRVVKIEPNVDAQNEMAWVDWGYELTDAGKATLWIDIPEMRVDPSSVMKGWKVFVKICVDKEISTICDSADCCCLIYIGELCCDYGTKETSLIFPYFTAANSGWWSGIAITNVSPADGTVMLTLYEQDGNVFQTAEAINVPANSMVVYNQAMLYGLSWDVVKGSLATAGKSRFYVEATADVSVMGFGMMAKTSTGESMGYLAVPTMGYYQAVPK